MIGTTRSGVRLVDTCPGANTVKKFSKKIGGRAVQLRNDSNLHFQRQPVWPVPNDDSLGIPCSAAGRSAEPLPSVRHAHQSQELSITRFRSERRKFGRDIDQGKHIEPLVVRLPDIVPSQIAIAESKLNEGEVISRDAPVTGGFAKTFEDLPSLAGLTGFAVDVSQCADREKILAIQLDASLCGREGVIEISPAGVRHGEIDVRGGELRIHGEDPLQLADGFVSVAELVGIE